jgi:CheY-like chemotaxis protein/anti-sigma regulatory factor (Ser/Thr protein kinase)
MSTGRPDLNADDGETRVVLVDDVDDVVRVVRTALRMRGGFEVVGQAGSGQAAVALVGTLRPDVVVLDLGLPDLAGHEVLTRIREASPRTQIVVLSGSEPEDVAWFEERTAGYVLKDQDLDYLVDLLENLGPRSLDSQDLELPPEPESAARARRWVTEVLRDWRLTDLMDDVLLVVSELVGNAVRHARTDLRVVLSRGDTAVRVEVEDHGPGTPEPRLPDDRAEGGRGLLLVGVVSQAWGVEDLADGKSVWADVSHD